MEVIIAILGVTGVVVAILTNLTNIFKFTQEQRDRRRQARVTQTLNDATPPHAAKAATSPQLESSSIGTVRQPASTPAPPPHTILTPDQRLRVFVSSTLQELAEERLAAKTAITELRLNPVMFELGARAHPPRALYRAYLEQSHIFVGIYWQRYGWVAPGETISGLEDEYHLSGNRPKLIYVKTPADEREERLKTLLKQIQTDDQVSYKSFSTPEELGELLENDLAVLLTERFAASLGTAQVSETPPDELVLPESNLPEPPTPLIGREAELQKVSTLLGKQEVRLVTLTGPGGVGKSRLGLEVARRLQAVFKDGVHFIPLSAVTDPNLVLPTIAKILEIPEDANKPILETFERHLEDKQLLLLLDNFEHITSAAPALSELLAEAPGLELLVTSRAPLRIAAEYVCAVPPLALPSVGHSPFEAMRDTEAVRLFRDRAKAVKDDFELTVDNARAVAELCYHLDGLPLAIELAAARVPLLSPKAILKRLDKRFDLLKGGARDLPERQQTLQNTLDWSFQLLSEADKRLFTRLAVFVGGGSLEAAEALCEAEADSNVLEGLASLVEKSLLKGSEVQGEPRFWMLETVREFAVRHFEASGEAESLRRRHAQYFLALSEAASAFIKNADKGWLDKLELEHDNFRSALRWSERHDPELGLRLAGRLAPFWRYRTFTREGRTWLDSFLAKTNAQNVSEDRARALHGQGHLAWLQGDFAAAQVSYDSALILYRELGLEAATADTLNNLAILAVEQDGDFARARALFEECVVLGRKLGQPDRLDFALSNLAMVTLHEGDPKTARTLQEEALQLSRAAGNLHQEAIAHFNLGDIAKTLGEVAVARHHYTKALTVSADLKDKEGMAYSLERFAKLAARDGEATKAVKLFGCSEALRESIGNPRPPGQDKDEDFDLLTQTKTRLGEAVFAATWTEGRALSLDKAIALALQPYAPTPAA
jgi:predicted ATPase